MKMPSTQEPCREASLVPTSFIISIHTYESTHRIFPLEGSRQIVPALKDNVVWKPKMSVPVL
jgi:hypothetical protein